MKIDWKLKGSNLLKFNCNKDQIVHPETCSDMVLMGHDGEINLTDWIKSGTSSIGENLASWINGYIGEGITIDIPYHQYSGATSGTELGYFGESDTVAANRIYAPYGSNSIYGVFRTGYGLTANDGTLNLNTASTGTNGIGGIKIGYNPTGTERALLLNNNGEAYVDLGTISSVPPTYIWKNNSWSIDKSEDTTSDYHAYAYQTVKEYTLQQDSERVLELDELSTPEYIHPVAITSNGILCTYVVPQTYNAYQGTANGLVPLTTASDRASKFLNGVGNWVLFETLSSTKHDSTKSYFVKGSGSDTTKFLKGDGTWDTPTNTTYDISTYSIDNSEGGTLVVTRDLEEDSFTIAKPQETPTIDKEILVPIVFGKNDDKNYHGIELGVLIDTLINDTDLLTALKTALESL